MRPISHGIPDGPPINYNTELATQPFIASGPQLQATKGRISQRIVGGSGSELSVSLDFSALLLIAV